MKNVCDIAGACEAPSSMVRRLAASRGAPSIGIRCRRCLRRPPRFGASSRRRICDSAHTEVIESDFPYLRQEDAGGKDNHNKGLGVDESYRVLLRFLMRMLAVPGAKDSGSLTSNHAPAWSTPSLRTAVMDASSVLALAIAAAVVMAAVALINSWLAAARTSGKFAAALVDLET